MPHLHNIIRQTQPQTRALPSRFDGEEGLGNFLTDGFRDAIAVAHYLNYDLIVDFLGRNGDGGLVHSVGVTQSHTDTLPQLHRASTSLRNRIKRISTFLPHRLAHIAPDTPDLSTL